MLSGERCLGGIFWSNNGRKEVSERTRQPECVINTPCGVSGRWVPLMSSTNIREDPGLLGTVAILETNRIQNSLQLSL